jgi:DNA-binding transcriptional LysR family regulator
MRCHVMIARSKSFAHAAAELGISQPSLHKAARDLEANLGVSLYRNSASGLVTTDAGEALARGFLLAINEMQSAAEELSAEGASAINCITIGVQMLDPAPFLAVVMEAFTRANPDTMIKMVNSTYEDLRQRIRIGLLDLTVGVLKEDGSPDLRHEPLFPDPYVVAARRGHPLAGRQSVPISELLAYDWIVPNPGAPRRLAFEHLFQPLGRLPRASIESHSYATIRASLWESDRLTVLTRSELMADERMGVLVQLNTAPLEPTPIIGLTMRANWAPTPRQQAFLDLLRDHGEELAIAG